MPGRNVSGAEHVDGRGVSAPPRSGHGTSKALRGLGTDASASVPVAIRGQAQPRG